MNGTSGWLHHAFRDDSLAPCLTYAYGHTTGGHPMLALRTARRHERGVLRERLPPSPLPAHLPSERHFSNEKNDIF